MNLTIDNDQPDTQLLRDKNDQFRHAVLTQQPVKGQLVVTRAFSALPPRTQLLLLSRFQSYDQWATDQMESEYDEHDIGHTTLDGERYFFKIDCYADDGTMEWGSDDPTNDAITYRVMTIGHAIDF